MASKSLSVTQLNNYIKGVFSDELILHNITVYGELAEFRISGSMTFFTLKEGASVISCIKYGTTEPMEIGMQVNAGGSVKFYPKSGKVFFEAKFLTPTGKGAQYAKFLELKNRLKAESVFDNPLTLPVYVKKVALVTSQSGAVLHDFMSVLASRGVEIVIHDVQVQGTASAAQIAEAVTKIGKSKDIDVVVIARGGGSSEDLASFNTEEVARAVRGSKIPVISAVGHETDYTLCDFAASERAGTPSIAAARIEKINLTYVANVLSAVQRINSSAARLYKVGAGKVYATSSKIVNLAKKSADKTEKRILSAVRVINESAGRLPERGLARVKSAAIKLSEAQRELYYAKESGLKTLAASFDRLSPLKILAGGFTMVVKDGKNIGSVNSLDKGDNVTVYFKDGTAKAEILEKSPEAFVKEKL